jgi:hypothetical protein
MLVPALFFVGCISPNNKAFEAPPDLTEANTSFIDTFSTYLETYRFDSLNTTGRQLLLAGNYTDEKIGTINSESFFQLLPESYPLTFPDSLVDGISFDSAIITFRYDYNYYVASGEAGKNEFGLYRLKENLNGDKSYFANASAAIADDEAYLSTKDAKRIGRFTYIDAAKLGKEIFEKWAVEKTISNDRQFLDKYLKGFAFKSLEQNSGLTRFDLKDSSGFPPATFVISYRNTEDGISVRKQLKFRTSSSVQYYTINQNVETKPWANIPRKAPLAASLTGNESLVQAGGGFATKATIPGIFSWKANQTKKIKIFKAELEIKPNLDLGTTTLGPPDFLRINMRPDYYIPNEADLDKVIFNDARIFSLLQQNIGSVAAAKRVQSTQIFAYDSENKVYKCNITRHIQDIIDGLKTSSSFNLYSAEWGNTFNRMFLRQGNNQKEGSVKLRIYYFPI